MIDQMRPMYPFVGNVTQIESSGRSESHSMRVQVQQRRGLELYGLLFNGGVSYTYRTASDDNDFTNPYQPEWGPSRRDHQVWSRFRIRLPEDVQFGSSLLTSIARLYAGAGIVADSDPAAELAETEVKLRTMAEARAAWMRADRSEPPAEGSRLWCAERLDQLPGVLAKYRRSFVPMDARLIVVWHYLDGLDRASPRRPPVKPVFWC